MTESQIEYYVERRTDRIDELFMRGDIDAKQYDELMQNLTAWAEAQYAARDTVRV